MNQERFEELKRIILDRAHTASACKEQYGRAYRSETVEELMTVITLMYRSPPKVRSWASCVLGSVVTSGHASSIALLARLEGLEAHARSVELRG